MTTVVKDDSAYLVITELFLPTKGGTAVWFDQVYRHLGGRRTHIITADVPGGREHDASHPNFVHRVRLQRHWWLRPESVAMYAKLFIKALAVGVRGRFDAIHAGRVLPEGLVGLTVARLIRRPLAIYAHGEEITTWRATWKSRAMTYAYTHANLVIANSDFTRQQLIRIGVPDGRIAVLHPGVDIHRFRPGLPCADLRDQLSLLPDEKLILSVGRLSRRKGFDQVIRCIPRLLGSGCDLRYIVIGTGEDREYLEKVARDIGMESRVTFLGHVEADDLPRWYNAADVFVMPNREIDGDTEGFGMVFVEAAACAKPSLAGTAGGTGSAVLDGVTGLRVDGTDEEAVAAALARLLQNRELARTLGANGYHRVLTEFSWEQVAARTRELCTALKSG